MALVIIRQDGKIDFWKDALKAQSPELKVFGYLEDHPNDDIEMALVWKHPKGSLAEYPNLKLIASNGAGVDFIFKDPDVPTGVPITRIVDTKLADDMSEHVLAVIMGHLKNLETYKLQQTQGVWKPRDYHRISDYTVGIMGLGELGRVLAEDLVRFGFKVQGWSNSSKSIENVKTFAGDEALISFLSSSEILVCLLPLTDKTTGILNASLFKQLPKKAFVINVARGGHLVDEDLIKMLDNGHLSGAGLDVYHQEPLPETHPFWQHEKIHMTPHYASVSDPRSVVPQILENYRRVQTGEAFLNQVSFKKGY
ncbi:MAG: glyoxylate/hydroxypyruvate reductase A [Pricia sp.]